jgi:glycosyltransferase 2 family protein
MSHKKWHKRLKFLLPLVTLGFIALAAYFLYDTLSEINWMEVQSALHKISWPTLMIAAGMVMINYLILATYDFLGLRFLKTKTLSYLKVLCSGFISYAFNFNLGAILGGFGLRLRVYSGWGLPKKQITLLALFSTLTVWLGYTFLLAQIFIFAPAWIQHWVDLSTGIIRLIGVLTLGAVGFYFYLSHIHYEFSFKENDFHLPIIRTSLLQLLLSVFQWLIPGVVIYFLLSSLGTDLSYGQIVLTYLVASMAGVITRVPGGLGVLEAVFLKMHASVPGPNLLVALLSFRVVYYLFPLALALPGYLFVEIYQKKKS